MKPHYRTVFISDMHLGSRGCRARDLSQFLKHVRCDRLFLVGDVLDFWALKGRWYWPAEHNEVVRRILNHVKHGTEVIYVPGNHDEGMRQYVHMEFGGVKVLPPHDGGRPATAGDSRRRVRSGGEASSVAVDGGGQGV